ncbi:hypothetical protein PoB_006347100 [Plakobranchus ocellatus]|uniref:Uncharacterized protein n=1 Tax=Plakobranchus ocellatus TaxID=259542 RepID=A0AAV4CYS4_9GAST|nr:hypothetical protein PoB_006347100 [Plakobranchus ocellatus]
MTTPQQGDLRLSSPLSAQDAGGDSGLESPGDRSANKIDYIFIQKRLSEVNAGAWSPVYSVARRRCSSSCLLPHS